MYFCKLIIKCIVYDRLRKYSSENGKNKGRDCSSTLGFFIC